MGGGVDARVDGTRHDLGRIVVVGGPPEWRRAVNEILGSAGFETDTCDSGTGAKALFGTFHPELVIMAAELTDEPAVDLCRWVRARSSVPVVVVAQSRHFDAVHILDLGADLVLKEPIGQNELLARLRATLRRRPPALRPDIVIHGDARLHRAEQTLYLQDGSIRLEGRELALVEALMRNGAKVTSRGSLQALLCVNGAELDRYVRRLRQRLEQIEDWRRIVSERGVGFRLLERRPARPPLHRLDQHDDPPGLGWAATAPAG